MVNLWSSGARLHPWQKAAAGHCLRSTESLSFTGADMSTQAQELLGCDVGLSVMLAKHKL